MHQALYTVAVWDIWLTIAIYIVALLLLLHSFSRLCSTVADICGAIFHNNSVERLEESIAKVRSRNLTLIFVCFFLSILISYAYCNRFSESFHIPRSIATIVSMLLFFVIIIARISLFNMLNWVNHTRIFSLLRKIFWSYFIFLIFLLLPAFFLTYIVDALDVIFFSVYLCCATLFVVILHASKIFSILKLNEFSISFRILYLCALEFLPIFLLVALFKATAQLGA